MIRETMEETGIELEEVVYYSSQPWPGLITQKLQFLNHISLHSVINVTLNSMLMLLKQKHNQTTLFSMFHVENYYYMYNLP